MSRAHDAAVLLTLNEAAAHCRVSPTTFKRKYQRRGYPRVQIGSLVRYRLVDLDQWIESLVVGSFEPTRVHTSRAAPILVLSPRAREILARREAKTRRSTRATRP